MRICFLVLAHSSPQLYRRLVATITNEGDYVVTHVDSKADFATFESACPTSASVVYAEERVDIKWGSWSMMRAEMAMVRTARQRFPDADYIWLISGDTYPLRPLSDIHDYLKLHSGTQFLNFVRMPAPQFAKPLNRISHRHFDYDVRNGRYRKLVLLASRFARRPYKRLLGRRQPMGGSQWVTITSAAADRLIEAADDSKLWRLARTSAHADEWFIQTVLCNDPEFGKAIRPALFWADFRPTTPVPRPPLLGTEQIDHLLTLPEVGPDDPKARALLMGRKFADSSLDVIDLVEAQLWPRPVTHHLVPEMV